MVDIVTVKMSSKGQIVIPSSFRDNFVEGDEILLIKDEDRIILKNKKSIISSNVKDLNFAKEIDKAYKEYDEGKFESLNEADFLKEIKRW